MANRVPQGDLDVDAVDESRLVTEDDTPLDSIFQEKQQRLLVSPLLDSWSGPPGSGRTFVAMANVGLFWKVDEPAVVPDMLLSLDVSLPADLEPKKHRSYFVWRFGKPPDAVVEVVSGTEGGELSKKRRLYERIGVTHYAVFDPFGYLSDARIRCFDLSAGEYIDRIDTRFDRLGLSLVEWEGRFEDLTSHWLRWADLEGTPIPTGAERAQHEAESARKESERAQRLAARLRDLGIDPDDP